MKTSMNIRLDNTHFLFLAYSGKVLNIKYLSVTANGGIFVPPSGNRLHMQSTTLCSPFFWPFYHPKDFQN